MKKVLKCGHLFSTENKSFSKDVNVYIENNVITEISSGSVKDGYELVDLSNKYVLPGLIDCHVHTCLSGQPNDMQTFGHLTQGDFTVICLNNAQNDLMAGFTTLRDEGGVAYTDIAVKNAINKNIVWGPRLFVSGPCITATGGHGDSHFAPDVSCEYQLGIVCDSPDECRETSRHILKYGADQIKVMSTGGVLSYGDDVGAPEFTFEELKTVCDTAKSKNRITSAHAHAGEGIKLAVKAGITSIEHGTMADEEAHSLMLEYGTWLVPTLSAGYNIMKYGVGNGIPAEMVEKCSVVVDSHFKTFKQAYDKGIKIAFGTDCGTPFTQHGKQASEFSLIVDAGIKPEDALMMATKNAATLLKMEDKIGSIEKGLFADIIAVDKNPIEDIKSLENVTFVMKDGNIYKNN